MLQNPLDDKSTNGSVPPGNIPPPEQMLSELYIAIYRHFATMSW